MRSGLKSIPALFFCGLAAIGFHWGARQVPPFASDAYAKELQVVLPPLVQVVGSFGDRYLAANLSGFRALVAVPERMSPDEFAALGQTQLDIAWLNPAHEDNYYIAAAILPWNGQLRAAQGVLGRAAMGRPTDWWPLFYFGFHQAYLEGNPALGAATLQLAADRAVDPNERAILDDIASRWYEKGLDRRAAAGVLQTMADQARDRSFRRYLEKRVAALRGLQAIDDAVAAFQTSHGRAPVSVDELLRRRFLSERPMDPFGRELGIVDGKAAFLPRK